MCNEKIESRLRELRKLSSKVMTNVVYASKVKQTGQVQSERVFKSNKKNRLVTIHDKSLLTPCNATTRWKQGLTGDVPKVQGATPKGDIVSPGRVADGQDRAC